jgi:hypothetical protein
LVTDEMPTYPQSYEFINELGRVTLTVAGYGPDTVSPFIADLRAMHLQGTFNMETEPGKKSSATLTTGLADKVEHLKETTKYSGPIT